jgi:hypothetical protein|tara:strand:+ start:154 stop:318 length:165 start_codon:yes stop_codon:yes gene_type:complete
MVDPIGDIIAGVGEAIAKDSTFLNENKKEPLWLKVLYYAIPMGLLIGFYFWVIA